MSRPSARSIDSDAPEHKNLPAAGKIIVSRKLFWNFTVIYSTDNYKTIGEMFMKRGIITIALIICLVLTGCEETGLKLNIGGERLVISFEPTDGGYVSEYELPSCPSADSFEPDSVGTDSLRVENAYFYKNTAYVTVNAYGVCDVYVYDIDKGSGQWLSGEALQPGEAGEIAIMKNYILRADGGYALLRRTAKGASGFAGEYRLLRLDTLESDRICGSYDFEYVTTARIEGFRWAPGEFNDAGYCVMTWEDDEVVCWHGTLKDGQFSAGQVDFNYYAALAYID